jgi:broad specificity phosphatase PhoE
MNKLSGGDPPQAGGAEIRYLSERLMKLVLVRHGESETNAGYAIEGPEPHLTERGRRQAGYAAQRARARSYDALYASPMSRALETACALAEATGLSPTVLIDLCEHRELPDFRGLSRSALQARYPSITLPDECREEGWWTGEEELEEALYDRARRTAALLRERHEGTDDRVVLVTHGGFGSALVSVLLGLPPCGYMRFLHYNCAFTRFDLEPGVVQLTKLNCTWHIPPHDRT